MAGKHPRYSEADRKILALFRAGKDDEATERLIAEYQGLVRSITQWPRWNFDPGTAEELEQDIFAALVRALPRFTESATLKTFITGIGHKRCVSRVRKWARSQAHEVFYQEMSDEDGRDVDFTADESFDPRRAAVRNEARLLARQLLNSIGSRCREILSLRFIEDLSYKEIAEKLGTTVNDVGKRLFHCKEVAFKNGKSFEVDEE